MKCICDCLCFLSKTRSANLIFYFTSHSLPAPLFAMLAHARTQADRLGRSELMFCERTCEQYRPGLKIPIPNNPYGPSRVRYKIHIMAMSRSSVTAACSVNRLDCVKTTDMTSSAFSTHTGRCIRTGETKGLPLNGASVVDEEGGSAGDGGAGTSMEPRSS